MNRGKDVGKRKRRPAPSATEIASRANMIELTKSAKKQQQVADAAAARSRWQAALSRGSMQPSTGAAASSEALGGDGGVGSDLYYRQSTSIFLSGDDQVIR